MAFIKIVEYASTIVIRTFDGSFVGAILNEVVYRKNQATVSRAGKNGVKVADKYLGQYNPIDINLADTVEITDVSSGTVTSPFAGLDDLYLAVNHVLQDQLSISGGVVVNFTSVQIVEMCDIHGCSDPKGTVHYDGAGASNHLGLANPTFDGDAATFLRIDWGDGIIEDFDNSVSEGHTYSFANVPFTATIRALCYLASSDTYFVVVGQLLFTGSGGSSAGDWTVNIGTSRPYTKFLRHFVYDTDGDILDHYDTDLEGAPYIASDMVQEGCCNCEEDGFYTIMIVDYDYELKTDDGGGMPVTTTLEYGKYNFISILVLAGTPTINGVAVPVGYSRVFSDNKNTYRGDNVIVTTTVNKVIVAAYYFIEV